MAAYSTEIPVGGLEAVDPNSTQVVAGTGAAKDPGLTIGGLKGVKLAGDDSATIREKLQEMINAREAQKGGIDSTLNYLQSYGGRPEDFVTNRRNYVADEAKREADTFSMRTQLAELNTAERLAQQKAVEDQNFYKGITAMAGGAPQAAAPAPAPQAGGLPAGGAPAPQAVGGGLPQATPPAAGPAPVMNQQQAAVLGGLYRKDPVAAQKELWKMMAATEADKDARTIGLTPGSPQYQQYILARTAPEAIKPIALPDENGFTRTRPGFAVAGDILGNNRPPAPAPAAAVPGATVAGAQVQPTGLTPAPQVQPTGLTPAPAATAGNLPPEQAAAMRIEREKAQIAAEQAKKTELAKTEATEETTLKNTASAAPSDYIMSARMIDNAKKYPTLIGKLSQPTIASAIGNFVQQGVTLPIGSISLPAINDLATQLDPEMRKLPAGPERDARMNAARELVQDFAMLSLRGAKMIQGQGAVSDNERSLIKQAAGDFTRMTPSGVAKLATAIACEASNAKERQALWERSDAKGMSWKDYQRSPEFKSLVEKQYYQTAKALKIENPPQFNPSLEGQAVRPVSAAPATTAPATANKSPTDIARQKAIDLLKG